MPNPFKHQELKAQAVDPAPFGLQDPQPLWEEKSGNWNGNIVKRGNKRQADVESRVAERLRQILAARAALRADPSVVWIDPDQYVLFSRAANELVFANDDPLAGCCGFTFREPLVSNAEVWRRYMIAVEDVIENK